MSQCSTPMNLKPQDLAVQDQAANIFVTTNTALSKKKITLVTKIGYCY